MDKTNKKSTKGSLYEFFTDDKPKKLMILNAIIALLWIFNAGLSYRSIVVYNNPNRFSLYLDVILAVFYIGITSFYACKYAKAKKLERGETV